MIAGDADEPLDQEEVGLARLDEYDDVVAPRLAVVDQRHPFAWAAPA